MDLFVVGVVAILGTIGVRIAWPWIRRSNTGLAIEEVEVDWLLSLGMVLVVALVGLMVIAAAFGGGVMRFRKPKGQPRPPRPNRK